MISTKFFTFLNLLLIDLLLWVGLTGCAVTSNRDNMQDCRQLCGKAGAIIYTNEYSVDTGAVKCGCREAGTP